MPCRAQSPRPGRRPPWTRTSGGCARHGGYRLVADAAAIDSVRFTVLADEARDLLVAGRPSDARRAAEQALELWRGRPYAGFADEPWPSRRWPS